MLFAEYLARELGAPAFKTRARFAYTRTEGLIIATSRVFMNESGEAATAALSFFKLSPEELCIAHDESDLAIGSFKYAAGRGAAGHNGVRSIMASLDTDTFLRLRLGIRSRPGKAGSFVLRPIPQVQREKLYSAFAPASSMFAVNTTP